MVLAIGKWINGKWVKAAAEAITETASKGRWVNGKWVKEATQVLEEGKVCTKMKSSTSTVGTVTSPVLKEATHTRLPEGMLPEELSSNTISRIIRTRYNTMRHGANYEKRIISADMAEQLKIKSCTPCFGINIEGGLGGGTMWTYRKPSWMSDNILDFTVLPTERVSMSVNAHPDIINVLDSFIARGEIVVNGKVFKTIKPPKAYYKICANPIEHFPTQSDPITLYFREPVSKEQLEAIKQITEPFRGIDEVSIADKLFHSGKVEGANWLSHARENTPDDLYRAFKRAQGIDTKLAQAVYNERGTKIKDISMNVYDIYDTSVSPMVLNMENYRYRISAGQQYAIDSFINDYIKALGRTGFDIMM